MYMYWLVMFYHCSHFFKWKYCDVVIRHNMLHTDYIYICLHSFETTFIFYILLMEDFVTV